MIQDIASVRQQEGYFRDLVERLVHQFEGRAHYDDEMAIIREAREALAKTENVSMSGEHGDGVTVGNAAALRAALEAVRDWFDGDMDDNDADEMDAMLEKVDAALDLPSRNCDRFSRGVDAVSAYYEKGGYPITVTGCDFADWLFAPAEGGVK